MTSVIRFFQLGMTLTPVESCNFYFVVVSHTISNSSAFALLGTATEFKQISKIKKNKSFTTINDLINHEFVIDSYLKYVAQFL